MFKWDPEHLPHKQLQDGLPISITIDMVKKVISKIKSMGESFQDFEAGFLKMLNSADNNSFSDLVSVYLKVFDRLTWSC